MLPIIQATLLNLLAKYILFQFIQILYIVNHKIMTSMKTFDE
jgi:hypothetical protein